MGDVPIWGVSVRDSPFYFPIVYQKGSAILGMLRRRLGAEAFDELFREYVRTFAGSTTTTAEFLEFVESFSEEEWVNQFFDDRVSRAGYTILKASEQRGVTDVDPVTLSLTQTGLGVFEGPSPYVFAEMGPALTRGQLEGGEFELELGDSQWIEIDPNNTLFVESGPNLLEM